MANDDYVSARRSGEQRAASFGGEIKCPEGVSLWKKTEGKHTFRIIATPAGEHNAAAAPGKFFHCLRYYSHGQVGPDGARVVCTKKTHGCGGKCAVCDDRAMKIADGEDEKITDGMAPKERCAMLVRVDDGDLQIYADSYHAFARALDSAIDLAEDGECDMLAHHTEGAKLVVGRFNEKNIGNGTWISCETVSISKDADPLSKADIKVARSTVFDECLVILDYAAVKAMIAGGPPKSKKRDDDEDEDAASKKKGKPSRDDDEDEDTPPKRKSRPSDEDEDDTPPKRSKRPADEGDEDEKPKRKARPADEDEEDEAPPKRTKRPSADDDDDEPPKRTKRPADEDDEEDPPKRKKRPAEDEDEDPPKRTKRPADDDDDEKPAKKPSKAKAGDDDDDW
jgi:hypothetical protein